MVIDKEGLIIFPVAQKVKMDPIVYYHFMPPCDLHTIPDDAVGLKLSTLTFLPSVLSLSFPWKMKNSFQSVR